MKKLLDSKNTYKVIAAGAVALLILGIIPLIYIGRYAHPCADDFTYGMYTHAIWEATGSLKETLYWAFRQIKISYDTWQGTFSSAFLMALSPAIWGENSYIWSPVILIGMLVLAHFTFGYVVLVKLLKAPKSIWLIISSLITFLMIESVPSPVNAYYWYNGAVHYNFMHGCAVLLFAVMIYIEVGKKRAVNVWLYLAACLLSVLCAGANYSTGLLGLLGLTFLVVLKWFLGQKSAWKLLPWSIYAFSFFMSVIAPGNNIRQENFSKTTPFKAVTDSFIQGIHWSRHWLTLQVVLFMLLLAPFLWKAVKETKFAFPVPIVVTLLSICSISCMFTPSLYAMGGSGPDRLINIIKLWFLLLLFVNEGYWMGYVARRLKDGAPAWAQKLKEYMGRIDVRIYTVMVLALLFLSFVIKVEDRLYDYSSYGAYVSLKAGEAQAFDREYKERLEILNGPGDEVTVKAFKVKPRLLFFDDIREDSYNWRNASVAAWYGKMRVYLEE